MILAASCASCSVRFVERKAECHAERQTGVPRPLSCDLKRQ